MLVLFFSAAQPTYRAHYRIYALRAAKDPFGRPQIYVMPLCNTLRRSWLYIAAGGGYDAVAAKRLETHSTFLLTKCFSNAFVESAQSFIITKTYPQQHRHTQIMHNNISFSTRVRYEAKRTTVERVDNIFRVSVRSLLLWGFEFVWLIIIIHAESKICPAESLYMLCMRAFV